LIVTKFCYQKPEFEQFGSTTLTEKVTYPTISVNLFKNYATKTNVRTFLVAFFTILTNAHAKTQMNMEPNT